MLHFDKKKHPRSSLFFDHQPQGRAEGESETQDRWKEFFLFLSKHWSRKKEITKTIQIVWNRFSAKEGASRSDQARPRTNMQANLVIIIIILKSMLIAVVVWTRLQSFCFTSDIGWEVWGGEERSPREVQRQGGGETWSSKASNQHTGISF